MQRVSRLAWMRRRTVIRGLVSNKPASVEKMGGGACRKSVGVGRCGVFHAEQECQSQCFHNARMQYCTLGTRLSLRESGTQGSNIVSCLQN